MKKIVLFMAMLGATFQLFSQSKALYGVASMGGSGNFGVMFTYDVASQTYTVKKNFTPGAEGMVPRGSLMKANNGKLYGMTFMGGSNNSGVLFEYAPAQDAYTVKHSFGSITGDGIRPFGSVMQAANGKLYGLTSKGGSSNSGVLFEFDPATGTYAVKFSFEGSNGSEPQGGLVQAANGKLYGMTYLSDILSGNNGVLFSYDPATSVYTKIITFNSTNGGRPYGDLIEVGGKLYAMTREGGANAMGIIFELDPATDTFTKKFDFGGNNGGNPVGTLLLANNGKLYGMASGGAANNGLIFEYDAATNAFAVKANFNMDNGFNPQGSLMQASDGKFYGLSSYGGTIDDYDYEYGEGTMFSFDLATNTITKLHDFDVANGSTPYYTRLLEVDMSSLSVADPSAGTVRVYPNPVEDVLHLQGIARANITLYSAAGQQLMSKTVTTGQLNLSTLPKGLYILKIEAAGKTTTHKVVKK